MLASPTELDLDAELKVASEAIYETIHQTQGGQVKSAEDALTRFTRRRMREDGIMRRVLPVQPATNAILDRSVDHDLPVVICEFENDSPAAQMIPFRTNPNRRYLRGNKYLVSFARITSPEVVKDVDELRTWIHDIRQVTSDNMVRDVLAEEDVNFFAAVNTSIVGPNVTVPTSGVSQWRTFSGGVSRDTVTAMFDILPSTPSSLDTKKVVFNNLTVNRVMAWGRDEMGGDVAQDIVENGYAKRKLFGRDVEITIKKAIVPTNTFYLFSDPEFIGKAFELQPTVMNVKRDKWWVFFSCYELLGGSIGNTNSVGRADMQ